MTDLRLVGAYPAVNSPAAVAIPAHDLKDVPVGVAIAPQSSVEGSAFRAGSFPSMLPTPSLDVVKGKEGNYALPAAHTVPPIGLKNFRLNLCGSFPPVRRGIIQALSTRSTLGLGLPAALRTLPRGLSTLEQTRHTLALRLSAGAAAILTWKGRTLVTFRA